jgi:hypothetical protein
MQWVHSPTKSCERTSTTLLQALVTKPKYNYCSSEQYPLLNIPNTSQHTDQVSFSYNTSVVCSGGAQVKYWPRHWLSCTCLWFSSAPLPKCCVSISIWSKPNFKPLSICYYQAIIWNSTINIASLNKLPVNTTVHIFDTSRRASSYFHLRTQMDSISETLLSIPTLYTISNQYFRLPQIIPPYAPSHPEWSDSSTFITTRTSKCLWWTVIGNVNP